MANFSRLWSKIIHAFCTKTFNLALIECCANEMVKMEIVLKLVHFLLLLEIFHSTNMFLSLCNSLIWSFFYLNPQDLSNCQYLMEDMKVLPNPSILYLNVHASGHSFGASSFHVLRMCLGIKKLVLVLLDNVKAEVKLSVIILYSLYLKR